MAVYLDFTNLVFIICSLIHAMHACDYRLWLFGDLFFTNCVHNLKSVKYKSLEKYTLYCSLVGLYMYVYNCTCVFFDFFPLV